MKYCDDKKCLHDSTKLSNMVFIIFLILFIKLKTKKKKKNLAKF